MKKLIWAIIGLLLFGKVCFGFGGMQSTDDYHRWREISAQLEANTVAHYACGDNDTNSTIKDEKSGQNGIFRVSPLASRVVIRRNHFHKGMYELFIPSDTNEVYWSKWILGWPAYGGKTFFRHPVRQCFFGKIRSCKLYTYDTKTSSDGTWTLSPNYGYQTYLHSGSTSAYIEWSNLLASGHDRLQLISYAATGILTVSIDGNDIGTFDTSLIGIGAEEKAFTFNVSDSARTIRITSSVGSVYFVGIRSFDSDLTANPSAAVDNISVGNDMITIQDGVLSPEQPNFNAVAGQSTQVMYANTCETTTSWKPDGGSSYKWTAYGAHYAAADANFIPDANTILSVDNVIVGDAGGTGNMYEIAEVPLGRVYEGNTIRTYVTGFGDYGKNNIRDDNDVLTLTIVEDFSPAGVDVNVTHSWTGNALVSNFYAPSVLLPPDACGTLYTPASSKSIYSGGAYNWTSETGANDVNYFSNDANYVLSAYNSTNTIKNIFLTSEQGNKVYFDVCTPSLQGGSSPRTGNIWNSLEHLDIIGTVEDWTWTKNHSVSGKVGNALSFDGTRDYGDTNSTFQPTLRGDCSFAFWINANGCTNSQQQVLLTETGTSAFHIVIQEPAESNTLFCEYKTPAMAIDLYDTGGTDFFTAYSGWTHIIATYDQSGSSVIANLYINGVLKDTETQTGSMADYTSSANLTIASSFTGSLDDVRIYNRALSGDEVRLKYRNDVGLVKQRGRWPRN